MINFKYEAEQTIDRLRQENLEVRNQFNVLKNELLNKDEIIKKLENHFNELELQLTETSKVRNNLKILNSRSSNIFTLKGQQITLP